MISLVPVAALVAAEAALVPVAEEPAIEEVIVTSQTPNLRFIGLPADIAWPSPPRQTGAEFFLNV